MGFTTIISLIKGIIDIILKVPEWIDSYVRSQIDKANRERSDRIKQGVDEAREAKTIEEKANAACKIEKALNPNSTCDSEPKS